MKHNKGFTLIEIIVGLAIMGIIAVPLTKIFIDGFKYQAKSQKKTEVTKVAEYVAEQLKVGYYFKKDTDEFSLGSNIVIDNIDSISEINKLSDSYSVNIEVLSKEEKEGEVLGVPTSYKATVIFDEFGNCDSELYDSGVLRITEGGDYLINNRSPSERIIEVDKNTEANVTFYKQGEGVTLTEYDVSKPRNVKFFKQVEIGKSGENADRKEALCNVKITVTSNSESTISASMDSTFNLPIEETEPEAEE